MTDVIDDALAELNSEIISAVGSRTALFEWPGDMKSLRSNEKITQWRTFGQSQLLGVMPTGGVTRSSEMIEAEGIVSEATFLVTVVYLEGVSVRMRMHLPGTPRLLYVGFVHDVGNRGKIFQLYCGETLRG